MTCCLVTGSFQNLSKLLIKIASRYLEIFFDTEQSFGTSDAVSLILQTAIILRGQMAYIYPAKEDISILWKMFWMQSLVHFAEHYCHNFLHH